VAGLPAALSLFKIPPIVILWPIPAKRFCHPRIQSGDLETLSRLDFPLKPGNDKGKKKCTEMTEKSYLQI
jgi:hypothetical protein